MAYRVLSPRALNTGNRSIDRNTTGNSLVNSGVDCDEAARPEGGRTVTEHTMTEPTEEAVRHALLGVIDPELGDNVVDLGMVRGIAIESGVATVTIALTVAGCPLQKQLRRRRRRPGSAPCPGSRAVAVRMGEMVPEEKAALMARARWKARDRGIVTDIPATTRILAVGIGQGRRRQVVRDGEPRRQPGPPRPDRGCPRCRHLGIQHPAHARRRGPGRGQGPRNGADRAAAAAPGCSRSSRWA